MRSQPILGLSAVLLLLCAAAAVNAQQTYDGRNGPHVFGSPGEQVYIRGQNEGPYQVPGVDGTFQNSPGQRQHVYTDEQGNTYVNQKKVAGSPGGHTISGPSLVARRVEQSAPATSPYKRPPRNVVVSRPDRVVVAGGGGYNVVRNRRDFQVARPDRAVVYGSDGSFVVQRSRRSPQGVYVSRPDGRSVDYSPDGFVAQGRDGRTVVHSRYRRARVQGENFVARDDQAGTWNDDVSVWKRPDGRTVSIGKDGSVITSGSPNGRGPQRYSG